ncbi:helix-turn-helix domain-containing protein [Streptomyces noursei]|uniref:helix-turn-helix domain-containing protein n=1 Tax=Streptomyces noursei TaxID=1971 RepID=UPI0021A57C7C|nr:helix-turn-helix domain-containing protein [Streptomyces noursei]UWS76979.1 helix-turn-helix domain-containing protein [Streptomyces noursei]
MTGWQSTPPNGQMRAAKTSVATRLRYVRHHHPEGPFTLATLAERAGVSKRALTSAESADGTNLTIETLVKVAHSLGMQRWAYFLDEEVFTQVNTELEIVKEVRRRGAQSVALRTASPPAQARPLHPCLNYRNLSRESFSPHKLPATP